MSARSVIAIDGPVASGKTAVGRLLASKLGYRFLDTGLMYRAITWAALQAAVKPKDATKLLRLAQGCNMNVVFQNSNDASIVVDGADVTSYLRDATVEQAVSLVSQVAGVREVLVVQQRKIAQDGCIVMAGRDIGTVVLQDAPTKIFLTASVQERARRRQAELNQGAKITPLEEVQKDLERRDKIDSQRKASPLRPARDAQVIVTDGMTVEQVADFIRAIVARRQ